MSPLRNALPRRAHKERGQPQSRKKFGLLEKHKDYVKRAKNFHLKQQTLQKLKEKAAFRNLDEFYFRMVKSKTVDGVHKPESLANKYTQEELLMMKTQDISYVFQKLQTEKKKIEKLTAVLHSLDIQQSNGHVYYAEDREEAIEIQSQRSIRKSVAAFEDLLNPLKGRRLLPTKSWTQERAEFINWKRYSWTWPCRKNSRKMVGRGNFVKMRLFVQHPIRCTSGGQNGRGEELLLCLAVMDGFIDRLKIFPVKCGKKKGAS